MKKIIIAKVGQVKFRIFLWLILAGVVGWLLFMGIVPSGKISYVYDFTKPSYFIGKLTPEERVMPILKYKEAKLPIGSLASQRIIGDPVYFALRTPRRFNKAKLILKYRRQNGRRDAGVAPSILPIIEAGVLVDKTIWRYDLQPIENRIIDQLAMVWDVINENGIMLLQREKKYNGIDEFLNNISVKISENQWSEIALYNYDLKQEFLLEDYAKKELGSDVSEPSSFFALRGSYQFYTYIKNEDLDFNFIFQDLNKNKDSDPIDLHLYYQGQLIDSRHIDDDGITTDSSETKNCGNIKLKLANLPEGVYKIELRVNDDIITKSITTKQQKMAFINKLWLVDSGRSDMNLFTDSKLINAQTVNPNSLQTVRAGESELKIEQTYKQFSVAVSSSTTKLILEKDDVILSGNGVFSFSEDSLINPNFKKVDSYLDIDQGGINYILADYEMPQDINEWKVASAEFDLTKAYREDGKYSFLISISGLRADDGVDDWVEVGEIGVELEGKSLWEKIRDLVISNNFSNK